MNGKSFDLREKSEGVWRLTIFVTEDGSKSVLDIREGSEMAMLRHMCREFDKNIRLQIRKPK